MGLGPEIDAGARPDAGDAELVEIGAIDADALVALYVGPIAAAKIPGCEAAILGVRSDHDDVCNAAVRAVPIRKGNNERDDALDSGRRQRLLTLVGAQQGKRVLNALRTKGNNPKLRPYGRSCR